MCGIAGLVNWGNARLLQSMTALLAHRGPDDIAIYEHRRRDGIWTGLGNRRLAIVDLTPSGRMPMLSSDGALGITYNGEIYNASELRENLKNKGYRFRTRTDTEVLLALYQEYGMASVEKLDGMFAFAVHDSRNGHLFLARDHFGVKPLYYVHRGERFAFASEIKSFLAIPDFQPRVNPKALQQYLTFLWTPDPLTLFDGVQKLPPAHRAIFKDSDLKIEQYWQVEVPPAQALYAQSEEELAEEVRSELRRAVKQQMVSDVPIGAFLSAGMDSTSIVSFMSEIAPEPVRTYTIGFAARSNSGEKSLDDHRIAKRFAHSLGCKHHYIEAKPDIASLLPRLTYHMDEPTADPALIMAYLVCEAARPEATVLLSGIGGDELFGGYRKYQAYYWNQLYSRAPARMRRFLESALGSIPNWHGTPMRGWIRWAQKFARSANSDPITAAMSAVTYLHHDLRADLCLDFDDSDPWASHLSHFAGVKHADFLHQLMYVDLKTFMPNLNLNYADKMGMAASVEVRVLFLDRRLVELTFTRIPRNSNYMVR